MGIFAEWQPAYAEAGLATFPVEGKKPCVGNYSKAGAKASAEWALKFEKANALGFACGTRNRITVLDIDEPDETLLADAFAKFGPTPVAIRTGSGKFHAWYRHNGEKRKIRSSHFMGRSVDILGGGFAVAPPSVGSAGAYEFIEGSLADVARLPVMRAQRIASNLIETEAELSAEVLGEGARNDNLWRACMKVAGECQSHDNLIRFAHALNESGEWSPLPAGEVERCAASAWRYQINGRNGFAGDKFVQIERAAHEILREHPDAAYLYQLLRAEHWGRNFCITNSWAEALPLSLARLQQARKFLLKRKLIECVRRQTRGQAAIYRFSPAVCLLAEERKRGV